MLRSFFVGWIKTTATISVGIALTLGAILLFGADSGTEDRAAPGPTTTRTVTVSPTDRGASPSSSSTEDSDRPGGSKATQNGAGGGKAAEAAKAEESGQASASSGTGSERRESHTSRNDSRPQPGSSSSTRPTNRPTARPTSAPSPSSSSTSSPRVYAQAALSVDQYACLDAVVQRESNWDVHATNPSSGAYGLGQALPGSKMASAGSDWENNGVTQVKWTIGYMNERYDSPCGAKSFHDANGYY